MNTPTLPLKDSGIPQESAVPDYPTMIREADVYPVAVVSPLERAPKLSQRLGQQVWFKREDMQLVRSFKLRGAFNMVRSLTAAQRQAGVIAASAGNHAQGLALAGRELGVRAVIVMPCTTPQIKVDAVRALGGEVVLHADTFDEANQHAQQIAAAQNLTFVPPYDHPLVIAGQGTVGMEILDQLPEPPDAIFVPVGGGGLIAGIAAWVKAHAPQTRIIGVEPDDAACLLAAMEAGEPTSLAQVGLFADGVAVRRIGNHTFAVAREHVDGVVTCSVDAICAAVRDIFEDNRTMLEPAGALSVAGMKVYAEQHPARRGETWVAINSGANVNFDRLRHIAERAELGEQREALLAVTIPETPGSFYHFCQVLGRRPITEFNYRMADLQRAHVFVGLKLSRGRVECDEIVADIRAAGLPVEDLSADEMAKVHIRYMVGGRSARATDEQLYRFEFPERPGALLDFLDRIAGRWNISLFHYRNHGAAFGRVLCGMQVPAADIGDCRATLDAVGYEYSVETENPAYRLFLGSSD